MPLLIKPFTLVACENFSKAERSGDRPYLGASLRSMLDQHGMMVLMVVTESPAWHANLKVGDILLEVDGKKID
jgi:S1-C subfamily serine protease